MRSTKHTQEILSSLIKDAEEQKIKISTYFLKESVTDLQNLKGKEEHLTQNCAKISEASKTNSALFLKKKSKFCSRNPHKEKRTKITFKRRFRKNIKSALVLR